MPPPAGGGHRFTPLNWAEQPLGPTHRATGQGLSAGERSPTHTHALQRGRCFYRNILIDEGGDGGGGDGGSGDGDGEWG